MISLYPSLTAASLHDLKTIAKLLEPYCAGFHLDVRDGVFVPTTELSERVASDIDAVTKHPSWVHLMVQDPMASYEKLTLKPGSIISFHIFTNKLSEKTIHDLVKKIKDNKCKAGLAIRPSTPVERIFPYLHLFDQILVMSVQPGSYGQTFLPDALKKIAPLIEQRKKQNLHFKIAMDGGINQKNIASLAAAKVDMVAIGAAIFASADPVQALRDMQKLVGE